MLRGGVPGSSTTHGAHRGEEARPVGRAREGVDHDHALRGHYEAGVGPALAAAAGVAHDRVDTPGEFPGRERPRGRRVVGRGRRRQEMDGEEECDGAQAEANAMVAVCWNTPPLLSVHTIVSGPSRSARRVKLMTGSRLIPEVQWNRATSSSP